jgi:hypothetical protein
LAALVRPIKLAKGQKSTVVFILFIICISGVADL